LLLQLAHTAGNRLKFLSVFRTCGQFITAYNLARCKHAKNDELKNFSLISRLYGALTAKAKDIKSLPLKRALGRLWKKFLNP